MIEKVRKATREADKLLNTQQRERLKALSDVEKVLFAKVWEQMQRELSEDGGRITSKKGFVSLAKAIDKVFDAIEAEHLDDFVRGTSGDMRQLVAASTEQFRPLAKGNDIAKIRSSVEDTMRKRLGIDEEWKPLRSGFLDDLVRNRAARDEVKKLVAKGVSGGIPMRKLEKALRLKVQGTKNTAGVLEKSIGGFVLDAYQVADRVTAREFARRLGLRYFIYSGGLIETSRPFCRKRNNKVFTTEEAERDWPKDSTLPRTKAEKEAGGPPADYSPLEDCGRWNCRHRIMYIDEQAAFVLRPELKSKR